MSAVMNRWGTTFRKGDPVEWTTVGGAHMTGVYVKLDKPSDFSRAYGRQAIIDISDGHTTTVGLDDIGQDNHGKCWLTYTDGLPAGRARSKCTQVKVRGMWDRPASHAFVNESTCWTYYDRVPKGIKLAPGVPKFDVRFDVVDVDGACIDLGPGAKYLVRVERRD